MAEHRRTVLEDKMRQAANTKRELQQQVDNMKKTIESVISRASERRESEEKIHNDEVERVQRTNDQLKTSLEALLSTPKR